VCHGSLSAFLPVSVCLFLVLLQKWVFQSAHAVQQKREWKIQTKGVWELFISAPSYGPARPSHVRAAAACGAGTRAASS
jgi:hypothetical protein